MMNSNRYARFFDAGSLLLLITLFAVFALPLFPPSWLVLLNPISFVGIFLASAYSLPKKRNQHLWGASVVIVLLLLPLFIDLQWVRVVSKSIQALYFFWQVISLVREIAHTKEVNKPVIVDAVAAYFLLGIAFSLLVVMVAIIIPGSYSIAPNDLNDPNRYKAMQEFSYYTFVTYTSTGFGDIVPLKPAARTLSILIASSGQLYIATIIAMLVGKYSSITRH
ncbi:MAG TPA: potassium channel family protein [Phnomibacter sp.]|nr:potassium channel family protein [Phnomibacter sp.]